MKESLALRSFTELLPVGAASSGDGRYEGLMLTLYFPTSLKIKHAGVAEGKQLDESNQWALNAPSS